MRLRSALAIVPALALLQACSLAGSSPATPHPLPSTPDLSALSQGAAPSAANPATVIFHRGTVLTMDTSHPTAQAIALNGDKILAVGGEDEILKLRGDDTTVIDLGGLTLMPGFVDAHNHLLGDDLLNNRDTAASQQMAIAYGVTTTTEMGMDQSLYDKLKATADAGKFRMRVNAYLGYTTNCGDVMGDWWKAYPPNQQVAPNLTIRGIKIFSDGGSCKVPAISVDYPGGGKGDLFFTQEQLNQMVANVQAAGFQVAIHALGDRAVEEAQNAIAAALNGQPNTYRHRIEHNAIIRPEMLARYNQIGIVPVIFGAYPTCVRTAGATDFKYLLPESVGSWEWPWRALVDANPGLRIAWHSDYGPFHWINPFYILWGFVTRNQVNTDGSICIAPDWLKAGALRVDEALPMMTINSAYALFMDKEVGSLEPGKFADLIVVSGNPLQTETDALKDIQVRMTMIGGKVEYCAAGAESLCPSASQAAAAPAATAAPATGVASPQSAAVTVTASQSLPDHPATDAIDGSSDTWWSAGSGPEQWIMLDLGASKSVSQIRLVISQYPDGATVHQLWAGADPNQLTMVHEFSGSTKDMDVLDYIPPNALPDIRFVKIITTQSPSWVAWREIEVK